MLVLQAPIAKPFCKYARFMGIILLLTGSFGALLTLRWYAAAPEKQGRLGGASPFIMRMHREVRRDFAPFSQLDHVDHRFASALLHPKFV